MSAVAPKPDLDALLRDELVARSYRAGRDFLLDHGYLPRFAPTWEKLPDLLKEFYRAIVSEARK